MIEQLYGDASKYAYEGERNMLRDPVERNYARMNMEDIIYNVLKSTRVMMHYKDLIQKAFEAKKEILANAEMNREAASILTDINIDGRFIYYGDGLWGLRGWPYNDEPKRGLSRALNYRKVKTALYKEEEEEYEDQEDELMERFHIYSTEEEDDDYAKYSRYQK